MLNASNLPLWLRTLCFFYLARYSTCSPINIIGDTSLVANTGFPPASSVNTSATNLGAPVSNCATLSSFAEWYQPSQKFDNGDCAKALELFYTDYTRDHEGIKYEFLASGVTPVHEIPTQRVPLKVAHGTSKYGYLCLVGRLTLELGTCYVVIAMRNMFVEGELPGETPTTSAGSDISSFTELYQNALDVYAKCSNSEVNEPGWYPAGRPPTSSFY